MARARTRVARPKAPSPVPGSARSMVQVRVSHVAVEPLRRLPYLVLASARSGAIAIDIGVGDAPAIASELRKVELVRPVTHDLLKSIVEECGARVDAVELRQARDHGVRATIVLRLARGHLATLDARPGDAVALALRTSAPIRVTRRLFHKLRLERPRSEAPLQLPDGMLTPLAGAFILESLRDEDFGKWKM